MPVERVISGVSKLVAELIESVQCYVNADDAQVDRKWE